MTNIKTVIPGLTLVYLVSYISILLNDILSVMINLEAITIGIIFGIILNNAWQVPRVLVPGIKFSSKVLLELGIILLGFRISIHGVKAIGLIGVLIIIVYIFCALTLTKYLGTKLFKTSDSYTWLVGIGTAICGSSAIAALAPTIGAEKEGPIAVSYINVMAAIGLLIYSFTAHIFSIDQLIFGFWSGLTLHGVGHALAAAFTLGQEAGEIGTFVKMTRVATLAPLILIIGSLTKRGGKAQPWHKTIPLYLVFFFLASLLNILNIVPSSLIDYISPISSRLILMAMIGLGLTVDFADIKKEGVKLWWLVLTSFVLLSAIGFVLTYLLY